MFFVMGMARKSKKPPLETIFVILAVVGIVLILYLSQKAKDNQRVASVNGQLVTTDNLDYILLMLPEEQRELLTKENLTEIAINNALIRQEIVKQGITISEKEINNAVNNVLAQNQITLEEYTQLLQEQGVTLDFVKSVYAEEILTYKLLNKTILKNMIVTDDEINEFYELYSAQINGTYEEVKTELEEVIKFQKAQQEFFIFVQELRENAEIIYY